VQLPEKIFSQLFNSHAVKTLFSSNKMSDFDDILKEIGPFGIWQKKIFAWMCLTSMAPGIAAVVYVFTGDFLLF